LGFVAREALQLGSRIGMVSCFQGGMRGEGDEGVAGAMLLVGGGVRDLEGVVMAYKGFSRKPMVLTKKIELKHTAAREIAARKGVGYQTLLKMLVHEGLRREARSRAG